MFRKLLLTATFLAILAIPLQAASLLFDNYNSHNWWSPVWGYGAWQRNAATYWTTYDSRNCMKYVSLDYTDGAMMLIKCAAVPVEDWSNVKLLRADVYAQSGTASSNLKVEVYDINGAQQKALSYSNVPLDTWTDIYWDLSGPASPVSHLYLIADNLGTNEATYYFDNLRLILNDGTTWYWDTFDSQPRTYSYNGCATTVNGNEQGFISHNVSSSTFNPGAGYLTWNYNGTGYAEMSNGTANVDLSAYDSARADVYIRPDVWTSTVTLQPKLYFWFGDITSGNNVYSTITSSCSWQTLLWTLPADAKTHVASEVKLGIENLHLMPGGTIYFDNLTFFKAGFGVVKSTSIAKAKPGDTVTISLTYSNSGDLDMSNVYITEAIPYNTTLAADPASDPGMGNADSIQYYVGSSWTGVYSASATKLKWKDNSLASGGSGTVSYKITIK